MLHPAARRLPATALLITLLIAAPRPAWANDLELLSGGSLPPNVMLIIDSSGSMQHVLWHPGFNPRVSYPDVGCFGSPLVAGSSCPSLGNPNDECPNNQSATTYSSLLAPSFAEVCNAKTIALPIDPARDNDYSNNYLNWLFGPATAAALTSLPTQTRTTAAHSVFNNLVNSINPDDGSGGYEENVRFGVAQFPGNVLAAIGPNNKAEVLTDIASVGASGSTPLWETLLDVGRYFAGQYGLGPFSLYGSTSPVDDECRRNFVVLMTDGQPNGTVNPNATFMSAIGNADGDSNECSSPMPATCTDAPKTGRDDGFVYVESGGNDWLDDVAYYLNRSIDLNPNLPGDQTLSAYTVGFAIDIPLLQETALNGNGSYFTTGDAALLEAQLQAAVLEIISRSFTFTTATVPSSRTSFGDAFYWAYFLPDPNSPTWEGHLEAFRLRPDGTVEDQLENLAIDPATGRLEASRVPFWDAAIELLSNTSRQLYTTQSGSRVDFNATNVDEVALALDPNEVPLYPNYPASGVDTTVALAGALVNYVGGADAFDEDGDSDSTELRDRVMGDIFHSNPLVVAGVRRALRLEDGYGTSTSTETPFLEQFEGRDRVLYVGANDGMLHAFDSGQLLGGDDPTTTTEVEDGYYTMGTGAELFGYVPGFMLDELKLIPRNLPRTQFYVEGSPVAADAWLGDPNDPNDTTKTPDEWATVLIVGMREGEKGYLALDVTDPSATDPNDPHGPYPRFLWEFQHGRLGETWSDPIITRVKLAAASGVGDECGKDDGDGDCREEWVAIFGGGYSEVGNPNSASWDATSLESKGLFMVALDSGDLLASVLYDPNDVTGPDAMRFAIPSTPAVLDLDFDGFADVVYAGDLGGQMWKWDLSALGVDSVGDARIDSWPAGIFFQAPTETLAGGATHYKSLFFPPSATLANGDLLLTFGTGERQDMTYAGDPALDENNRYYAVKDLNPIGGAAFSTVVTESDLTDITGSDYDTNSSDLGFFFVARDGEKFVSDQTIFSGFIFATAFLPDTSGGLSACGAGGESFLYVFNVVSGLGFYFEASIVTADAARRVSIGVGIPTSPRISISTDADGSVPGGSQGDKLYVKTSSGQLLTADAPPPNFNPVELIYWREN